MKRLILTICLCVLFVSSTALAVPIEVIYTDGPQDPLVVPKRVDELGIGFPTDELIDALDYTTDEVVCFDSATPDDPCMLNVVVSMINLTPTTWDEVWYVADPEETFHSNFDGFVGGAAGMMGTAFRIDNAILDPLGIHWPLIAEIGGIVNGLWEPFEIWEFVIQDYVNVFGKPASLLGSIGVPSMAFPPDSSSGSIIAIPEPATVCLLGLGSLALLRKKRRA